MNSRRRNISGRTRSNYRKGSKKQADPVAVSIVMQSFFAILIIATVFCSKYISADLYQKMQTFFQTMITTPLSEQIDAEEVIQIENGLNTAKQTVEDFWQSVFHPENTQFLLGQGGFGAVTVSADQYKAPDGFLLSPVYTTVQPIYPTDGVLSSGFGWRKHPITGEDDFHTGLDIAAKQGASIYAIWGGEVTDIGESPIYGKYIEVSHGDMVSFYGHCSEIIAEIGYKVKQGERIALVGSTGMSTGPHVHLMIKKNGLTINPEWLYGLE